MRFSKSAKLSGASGFFFDSDKSVPSDAIEVSDADVSVAINLPTGASFDFDASGKLLVTPATVQTAAQILAGAISDKWDAIKAERDRRKSGGVKVGAKWFHSDDGSRIQQIALVMMAASIPAGLQWKSMDGSFVTMTQTLAAQVFAGVVASDQAIFTVAETHKAAMEASADPASYDFSTGWPETFGG